MAGKIPQTFIQEIIARTDIVALVQARLSGKLQGDNFSACCPFHNEKSPSFTVSQSKQFYYCFGCSAHGNAINFLMEYDRLPFVDAVTMLAEQLGMTVPTDNTQGPTENLSPLYNILTSATKCFQKGLTQSPDAITYLKSRGLTGETAKAFAIGFAPAQWDFLCKAIGTDKSAQQNLQKTGMIIEKSAGRFYDRFRDRIMFPIRDLRGRTIAFGGRVLKDEKPKYLNSPETAVFHKSKTLYGLYEAYQRNRQFKKALVVEGYMDVVSLAQHGIHYAVATLGTALNTQHIQLLSRYTSDIIFCFDGDLAGQKAAWKALTICLPMLRDGLNIRFLFLPENEDPDTLIQKIGHSAFEEKVNKATPLTDVFFKTLADKHPIDTIAGKAAFAKEAILHLNTMPQGIFKNLLFDQLAKQLSMTQETLHQLTDQTPKPQETKPEPPAKLARLGDRLTPVQQALQLILHKPALAAELSEQALFTPQTPEERLLLSLINKTKENEGISTAGLLTLFDDRVEHYLAAIAAKPLIIPEKGMRPELLAILTHMKNKQESQTLNTLIQKSKQTTLTQDEKTKLQGLLSKKLHEA